MKQPIGENRMTWMLAAALLAALGMAPALPAGAQKPAEPVLLAQASGNYRSPGGYLGEVHRDQQNGFTIAPPAQWYLTTRNPRFAVRFSDKSYNAFIIVAVVKTDSKVNMDNDFKKFINRKNREVKESIPSFQVLTNRTVKVNRQYAYRTEAVFQAGPNQVLMNIYYLPANNKIFIITTVCPQATVRTWEPLFDESLATFSVLE